MKAKRILILENHKELFRLRRLSLWFEWRFFSYFKRLLEDNGYELEKFKKGAITRFDLETYDLIIEGLPQHPFLDGEIQVISDYIQDGGGLLIMGGGIFFVRAPYRVGYGSQRDKEWIPRLGGIPLWKGVPTWQYSNFTYLSASSIINNLNQLSAKFNVKFGSEILRKRDFFPDDIPLIEIDHGLPHPILRGVTGLILVDAVNVTPMRPSETIQILGMTDGRAITPNQSVLIHSRVGKGKVLAMGSPSPFIGFHFLPEFFKRRPDITYGLYRPTNLVFTMNVINWLAK